MKDTIAAISTNNIGVGAINIIRISGTEAFAILTKIFSNSKIGEAPSHTIHYGYIKEKDLIVDEVLVMIMKAPKTYTKEDIVEINCHGGTSVTKKILELVLKNGARLAEPGEFTKRAFLNGRINLMEAEAVNDLLEAKIDSQSQIALNSLNGKTTELISELREKIVSLLANIEVNIDYPEYQDELQITKQNITPMLEEIKYRLNNIIKESQNGQLIKNGINVAIIGKPNVGKSSLLNALIEEDKAIVTDIQGTTRDIIEGQIIYQGILINFLDTAGIRQTSDEIEKIGVEKSKKILAQADIAILVLNNNEKITEEEQTILKQIEQKTGFIFVNKTDLPTNLTVPSTTLPIIKGNVINNEGIENIKKEIIKILNLENINEKDYVYITNTRQISLIKKSLTCIENVIKANQDNLPIDILAIDLKEAWDLLGQVIGESYEEELVDNIFKRFCLGK